MTAMDTGMVIYEVNAGGEWVSSEMPEDVAREILGNLEGELSVSDGKVYCGDDNVCCRFDVSVVEDVKR